MRKFLAIALASALTLSMASGCKKVDEGSPAPDVGSAPAGDAAAPAADTSAPADNAASGDVIKIGVFEPQTGENGGGGLQEVYGIRYANQMFPTVNIGGKEYKIELVEADNKSDKTEAVTAAQSLISAGCSVVLGSYGSGVSIAAGEIFADAQVPAIGCSCTNPQVTLGNDYYFRVCFIDPFQGTVMAMRPRTAQRRPLSSRSSATTIRPVWATSLRMRLSSLSAKALSLLRNSSRQTRPILKRS